MERALLLILIGMVQSKMLHLDHVGEEIELPMENGIVMRMEFVDMKIIDYMFIRTAQMGTLS